MYSKTETWHLKSAKQSGKGFHHELACNLLKFVMGVAKTANKRPKPGRATLSHHSFSSTSG